MKKEAPEEEGNVTGTIGKEIGGNRRDGARRRVKKDEVDIEDDRQNCIPTMTTTTLPASSSPIVPDPMCSSSSCSGDADGGNTDWRPYTGYRDDDDPNDAVDDVAVGTGTNKKRKSDHLLRDHLKRKKSKRSIQATNNNSTIFNIDDNATNDGMQDNDDDDDNYYNIDDNNSVVVVTDTTTTTNGEKVVPNKQEEKWNKMYTRLQKYNEKHQSTNVPKKFDKDPRLANWVSHQRQFYSKNSLAKDRINRLNSIGFVWSFKKPLWNEMYDRLVDYNEEKKSTCVPLVYPADLQLGRWVSTQRKNYKTKNPALTIDRISKLNSIGFVWNPKNAQWTDKYLRLIEYKKQHESTCVPHPYEDDPSLGKWVSAQRAYYKSNKSYLAVDRIGKLDSIGFVWNPLDYDAQWKEKYERLVNYKKQNKTTCVPALYPADPQLGRWVRKQRSNYDANESCLTMDRIAQLDSIGFVWKIRTK